MSELADLDDVDDADLVGLLRRVASTLAFRRWVRRALTALAVLVILLFAAVGYMRHVQIEGCRSDNRLRSSYVHQWQPILNVPPTVPPPDATDKQREMFAAQLLLRAEFQRALDSDFAPHDCPNFFIVA